MDSPVEGYRLSPQQKNLWRLHQAYEPGPFRAFSTVLIEGKLTVHHLQGAVEQIVSRHEILRTTFKRVSGVKIPFQIIGEAGRFSWLFVDLGDLDAAEQEARIAEHFATTISKQFDLVNGPLVSITLIKRTAQTHILLLSLPSLCADSATLSNFIDELRLIMASPTSHETRADPLQYADFAEWQCGLLEADDEHTGAGKGYWQNVQSDGLQTLTLPFEKRVRQQQFAPRSVALDLTSFISRIEGLAREQETSISAVLFACWQALIWRLAGQPEYPFALYRLSSGRESEDLAGALGLFGKYLPMVADCKDESFITHLRGVTEALNQANEWSDYFDPAVSESIDKSIGFDFEQRRSIYDAGDLSFSIIDQHACVSAFKLKLSCVQSGATFKAGLHFDQHTFEEDAVKHISGYFQRFLSGLLENPLSNLSEIEIMDAVEHRKLLVDLNQTAAEFPTELDITKTVQQLFENQVAQTPNAPALVCGNQRLSYDELNSRANQLAHLLRRKGVGPDVRVGLCVERSAEMIVGMMAILKAGGAYVPLNLDHPRERLAIQLAESNACILITSESLQPEIIFAGDTINLDRERSSLEAEPKGNLPDDTSAENLVYVIYTSGSTGTPKGVAVRHRNLINYTAFILSSLGVDVPRVFATVSTISADLGNTCIFPALLSGGCLHVIGNEIAMEGDLLRNYVIEHRIEVLKIVPSHLKALLATQDDAGILPSKYLILGGEALTWDLIETISRLHHTCRIINHYGPTETTVGSLTFRVDDDNASNWSATVPIGRPIANTRCYILDSRQRPVPFGVVGELCIGGAGVASGYLNQPNESAERFILDPFGSDGNSRLYRTGDLARYLTDGNIEFLGRADRQVKVRGYRVELDEVEAVLSALADVRQAVVMLNHDQAGNARLVAYLVSSSAQDQLRAALQQKLPDYMIPSTFVFLKALPLTANGKVDRVALTALDDASVGLQINFVAPRFQIEKELAGMWEALLKVKAVGVHDNFFDLGGHSLLATQLVSRMRKEFQMEIPLRTLFETPTVAALAERIEQASALNTARLLSELEQISDDEAARMLRLEK